MTNLVGAGTVNDINGAVHLGHTMKCANRKPTSFISHCHASGQECMLSQKCAGKRVPKQNERSCENVNVLVPHIAALFKLLIAKANIPRS